MRWVRERLFCDPSCPVCWGFATIVVLLSLTAVCAAVVGAIDIYEIMEFE